MNEISKLDFGSFSFGLCGLPEYKYSSEELLLELCLNFISLIFFLFFDCIHSYDLLQLKDTEHNQQWGMVSEGQRRQA